MFSFARGLICFTPLSVAVSGFHLRGVFEADRRFIPVGRNHLTGILMSFKTLSV